MSQAKYRKRGNCGPQLSPSPAVPTFLSPLSSSPTFLHKPTLHPFLLLTQSRNSSSPQPPTPRHPPSWPPPPLLPQIPAPSPSQAPLPNPPIPLFYPGVLGTPDGLPGPRVRARAAGGAMGPPRAPPPPRGDVTMPEPPSSWAGWSHPPVKAALIGPAAAGKAGPVGGRTPWWPGLRSLPPTS